jgi:hypothetical protein
MHFVIFSGNGSFMTLTPEQRVAETEKTLRREQRLSIWLPFGIGAALLLVVVVIAAAAPNLSVTSNFVMTILLLCPAVVCLLPVYFMLVLAVFGLNSLYNGAAKPLRSLERLTAQIASRTTTLSDKLARQSINLNARVAPLTTRLEHAFDERKDDHEQSVTQQ